MATPLEGLLATLDPARTLDQTASRADAAVNSFRVPRGRVESWDEFTHLMAGFLTHVETRVLRLRAAPDASVGYQWDRCAQRLRDAFGRQGDKAAFEMARTGVEGGLHRVLREVAQRVAAHYAEAEIAGRIYEYWNCMSAEEQIAAAREYLAHYGHLLPSEMTEGSAARILANFPQVLQQHPELVQRIRRVGR